MIKKILFKQKGIIVSDAIISILIIMLFVGIITSLITNIVLESTKIKLNSQQLDWATEILEYAQTLPYDNVTEENLINYFNNKNLDDASAGSSLQDLDTSHKIVLGVEKFNETVGNTDKLDLIKIVTVTVSKNLIDKEYSTQMCKLIKATMIEAEEKL